MESVIRNKRLVSFFVCAAILQSILEARSERWLMIHMDAIQMRRECVAEMADFGSG